MTKFGLYLVCLLGSSSIAAFAEEKIVFSNISEQTIYLVGAHQKNNSVDGINGGGSADPYPLTYTKGLIVVAPHKTCEIPIDYEVKADNLNLRAKLVGIRVLVRNDAGDFAFVHPSEKAKPQYYPVHKDPKENVWEWKLRGTSAKYLEDAVKNMSAGGEAISLGMFYRPEEYLRTSTNGKSYYGVGAPGTYSSQIIDEFWKRHAVWDGIDFHVINNTQKKQDFQLEVFDVGRQEWRSFKDFQTVEVGKVGIYPHVGVPLQLNIDPQDNTYGLKVQGRDFTGAVTYWGPWLKARSRVSYANGKRRETISIALE